MQTNEDKDVEVQVPAGELNGDAGVEKETDGEEGEDLDGEAEGDESKGEDAGEGDESDDE